MSSCDHPEQAICYLEDGEIAMRCERCAQLLPLSDEMRELLQRRTRADGKPAWQDRSEWIENTNGVKGSEEIA